MCQPEDPELLIRPRWCPEPSFALISRLCADELVTWPLEQSLAGAQRPALSVVLERLRTRWVEAGPGPLDLRHSTLGVLQTPTGTIDRDFRAFQEASRHRQARQIVNCEPPRHRQGRWIVMLETPRASETSLWSPRTPQAAIEQPPRPSFVASKNTEVLRASSQQALKQLSHRIYETFG